MGKFIKKVIILKLKFYDTSLRVTDLQMINVGELGLATTVQINTFEVAIAIYN